MTRSSIPRLSGRVVAAHGRHFLVRCETGSESSTFICFTRGRKSEIACGDQVLVEPTGTDQGVIDSILPRNNLMYRSDGYRRKMLAANLSLVMIVVATEPSFSEELLGRALVAAGSLQLPAEIVLNKIDLTDSLPGARARLSFYSDQGYIIHQISTRTAPFETASTLMPHLQNRTTLFMGQSGMGKSTLLNLLVPGADAATREISEALHTGKHTTTDARLYDLPGTDTASSAGSIIDTPGFQEFGLAHLSPGEIERAFPEFQSLLGTCRFYNCTHLAEPGCAIRQSVEAGLIPERRYALFVALNRDTSR